MRRTTGVLPTTLGAALLFALAAGSTAVAEEVSRSSAHGLSVEVRRLKEKTGDYWKFQVTTVNANAGALRFTGRITLLQQSPSALPDPEMDTVGACVFSRKTEAGRTMTRVVRCKGGHHTKFRFDFTALTNAAGQALTLEKGGGSRTEVVNPDARVNRSTTDRTPIRIGGLSIVVTETRTKVGPAWRFGLFVVNAVQAPRRFKARLTLYRPSASAMPDPPPVQIAACPVFWTMKAGATEKLTTSCTSDTYSSWKLEILEVYDENNAPVKP